MSKYLLSGYLVLAGLTGLLTTTIPHWVVDVSALAAAAGIIIDQVKK